MDNYVFKLSLITKTSSPEIFPVLTTFYGLHMDLLFYFYFVMYSYRNSSKSSLFFLLLCCMYDFLAILSMVLLVHDLVNQ